MLKKIFKTYFTNFCLVAIFLLSAHPVWSADEQLKHKISSLKITTDPKNIKGNSAFSLSVIFKLRSDTGIQTDRIKILLNNKDISSVDKITVDRSTPKKAKITFTSTGLMLDSQAASDKNKIIVRYLLTQNDKTKVVAKAKGTFKSFNSDGTDSTGKPGPDDEDSNTGSNTRVIIDLSAKQDLPSEDPAIGFVSKDPQKIILIAKHDQKAVPGERTDTFSKDNSVILNNLQVFKIDRAGNKENVTDTFVFNLMQNTTSAGDLKFFETRFISDELDVKEKQTYLFKANLDSYLKSVNLSLGGKLITKDKTSISFEPVSLSLGNISGDFSSFVFEPVNLTSSANNTNDLQSQLLTITGSFTTEDDLGGSPSIDGVSLADVEGTKITKSNFTIGKGSKKKINLSASLDDATPASVQKTSEETTGEGEEAKTTRTYSVTVPLKFQISESTSTLLKKKKIFSTSVQGLNLLLSVFVKNSNDVDVDINGGQDATSTVKILDEPKFVTNKTTVSRSAGVLNIKFKYRNFVEASVDPLNLEIAFLDANGSTISSNTYFSSSFSKIKSSKGATATFKAAFSDPDPNFATELANAAKVRLRIKRADSYLSTFGFSYATDGNRDSLTFSEANENQAILDLK